MIKIGLAGLAVLQDSCFTKPRPARPITLQIFFSPKTHNYIVLLYDIYCIGVEALKKNNTLHYYAQLRLSSCKFRIFFIKLWLNYMGVLVRDNTFSITTKCSEKYYYDGSRI